MEEIKERRASNREIPVEDWFTHISAQDKNLKAGIVPVIEWRRKIRLAAKALRFHQWVKNVLVFAPFFLAHRPLDIHTLVILSLAWVSFGFAASSAYVINDILDIDSDRKHPKKRHRPFAASELATTFGIVLSSSSVAISLMISIFFLEPAFLAIVGLYLIISLLYSLGLKQLLLVDVLVLVALYTLRIYAGGLVLDISISNWMLAFSAFFFMSLALLKRYTELNALEPRIHQYDNRRYYEKEDLNLLQIVGVGAGLLSVLVLVLYVQTDFVLSHYAHPDWLWLAAPPLFYWINRMWFLAERGILKDDPIAFSIKDKMSYVTGGVIALVFILSSYL